MTDDLVKRLRAVGGLHHDGATRWYVNPDGPEAADRIEHLQGFADYADKVIADYEDALLEIAKIDYRGNAHPSAAIARAALREKKDGL
jgi:hypothetical protein